jgi:hypothetical protein
LLSVFLLKLTVLFTDWLLLDIPKKPYKNTTSNNKNLMPALLIHDIQTILNGLPASQTDWHASVELINGHFW